MMKKFSKTERYNPKEFIVEAKVILKIKSESSGEAGYLSDSILGSIESIENFKVLNIKENTIDDNN
jgi:hypothetical protein